VAQDLWVAHLPESANGLGSAPSDPSLRPPLGRTPRGRQTLVADKPCPLVPRATTRDGLRIAFDDSGAGEPAFLLCPGWCDERRLFDALAPRLAPRRVLRLDWRGHGDSSRTEGDFGTAELVEDALAVMTEAEIRQVVPVTQAHAGWAGLELARRLGGQVRGLVFLSWTLTQAPPAMQGGLRAMASPPSTRAAVEGLTGMWTTGVGHEAVLRHVARMRRHPDADWARAAREILAAYNVHESPLAALGRLGREIPAMHVRAASDPPTPEGKVGLREVVVPGTSHFPALECPEETARHVLSFMDGLAT
jgi:pimeloyl-ACP methyl ester carboxylesterase